MKKLLLPILACTMLLFAAGCSDETTSPPTTGRLVLYMTDAPMVGVEKVLITFSSVEAHIDGTWITVTSAPQTIDLLEWNNGKAMVLGDKELGPGKYTQIRLNVSKSEIVVDGVTKPLTIPSGDETGLKLTHNFDIVAGTTVELMLDFDVTRSVNVTGNGEYKLKPTIRVIAKPLTGAISGVVSNPTNTPVATLKDASNATVTTALVNPLTGAFKLAFIPAGTYTVTVEDAGGLKATRPGILVSVGAVTDIGSLTLQ